MSLVWLQVLMGGLFIAVWLIIGQIIVGQRRNQRGTGTYGAKNV